MAIDLLKWLLLIHVGATLAMGGAIWIVQVVQYPLFNAVGTDGFARYAAEHGRRISYVVIPLMLIEIATAALFVLRQPPGMSPLVAWIGLGLIVIIWASTFLVQVPQHAILGRGFDKAAYRLLVRSNWIRTIAWTARAVLVLWCVARAVG